MEIIRHYACTANEELRALLDRAKLPYQQHCPDWQRGSLFFDISEADPLFERFLQIPLTDVVLIKRVKYTKKEMDQAQWFTCVTTTTKVNLTREHVTFSVSEQYGEGLAHHRELTGAPFYVSRSVTHGKNQHFFGSDEATNQLFCTEHAKKLLEKDNIPVSFRAVCSDKTDQPVGDLYDIVIDSVLPAEALDLSNCEERFRCPICGKETVLPPLFLKVYKPWLDNMKNVCKTEAVFGWGGNYAASIPLISGEVYRFLVKNHLTRGLLLEPVMLIDGQQP